MVLFRGQMNFDIAWDQWPTKPDYPSRKPPGQADAEPKADANLPERLPESQTHVFSFASGVQTLYIEPGSPWENGYVESFNARMRDELLDGELF